MPKRIKLSKPKRLAHRGTRARNPQLFPENAHAALVFTADGQIIWCSQDRRGIQRKGMSPETVGSVFANAPVWSGFLPADVWSWGKADGAEWVALVVPAQIQTLLLTNEKEDERFTVPLPPLVFAGRRLDYYIWAAGDEKWNREPGTPAYNAPFPNVDAEGRICFGANILPPASTQTIHAAWDIFLNSPFNAHTIANKSKQFPDDVRQLWRALSEQQADCYPYDDLQALGGSLGWVLERNLMRS